MPQQRPFYQGPLECHWPSLKPWTSLTCRGDKWSFNNNNSSSSIFCFVNCKFHQSKFVYLWYFISFTLATLSVWNKSREICVFLFEEHFFPLHTPKTVIILPCSRHDECHFKWKTRKFKLDMREGRKLFNASMDLSLMSHFSLHFDSLHRFGGN